MSEVDGPFSGDDEHDPISLCAQVDEMLTDHRTTPPEVLSALIAFLVRLREALDAGQHPDHAEEAPDLPGVYTCPLPGDLGLVEYHETKTLLGPGFYVARVVRADDFPDRPDSTQQE